MAFRSLEPKKEERAGLRGGAITNFGVGIGSSIGKGGLGLGQAFLKASSKVAEIIGAGDGKQYDSTIEGIEKIKKGLFEDPYKKNLETTSGRLGELTGDIAQFATGNAATTGTQSYLRGASAALLKDAPALFRFGGRTAARVIPEAVSSGLTQYGMSGGDAESAETAAKWGGILSGTFGAAGDLYRKAYSPDLFDSALKGLGINGKMSGGQTLRQAGEYIEGLKTLKERAPNIIIKDTEGIEKAFDPTKSTYPETLQAWNEARKQIYEEFSTLAKQTSEEGLKVDLDDAFTTLSQMARQPRTSVYKNAAIKTMKDLVSNFGVYDDAGELVGLKADPSGLETYLADLNKQAATVLTSGTTDRALGEVSASASKLLREKMDDLISNARGEGYQVLRDEYASLKGIESGLVNQFKKAARKTGGGLTDYMHILSSGDLVNGLISGNPAWAAAGAAKSIFGEVRKRLVDPERYLQRAFELIDQPSDLGGSARIFGSEAKNADFKLGAKMVEDVKAKVKETPAKQGGFIKPGGFKSAVVPETAKIGKSTLDDSSLILDSDKKVFRGEGKGIGNSTLVNGKYFADSKEFASQFGDVSEEVIPKGSKIFNLDTVKDGKGIIPQELLVDQKNLTKYLIDNGFEYTQNTNTRGVEYVKLNRALNELEDLATSSKSLSDFKQKVMSDYEKFREELARLSENYTSADHSRLRSPIEDIYKRITEQ